MCDSCDLLGQLDKFSSIITSNNDEPDKKIRDLLSEYCTQKKDILQLEQEIESEVDSKQSQLKRKLRSSNYKLKKSQSELALELIYLAKKLKFVSVKLKFNKNEDENISEYLSLLNEVIAQAIDLICTDLKLDNNYSLTQNILNWITKITPLRLEYRWKDIMNVRLLSDQKSLLILQECIKTYPKGFTLEQFIEKVRANKMKTITEEKLQQYLQKKIEKYKGEIIENQGCITYKFDVGNIQFSGKQTFLQQSKRKANSLNQTNKNNEDTQTEFINLLSDNNPSNNFWEILKKVRDNETTKNIISLIFSSNTTEKSVCNQIFQKMKEKSQDDQTQIRLDSIFQEIAVQTNSNTTTIRSQYERNCLPHLYKAIIDDFSPHIFHESSKETLEKYEQKDQLFKRYIEEDKENKLRNCYLIEYKNKAEIIKKHTKCNAHELSKQILPIFGVSSNITSLAEKYGITRAKLDRFWKLEVLKLLCKITLDEL